MDDVTKPKVFHQYVATLFVSLGGLSFGNGLGWSSPAVSLMKKQMPGEKNIFWIVSIMPVGAAASAIMNGFLIDSFGRKYPLVLMGIVTCLGYVVLMFASNVPVYCIGRFITGFGSGPFCITCPVYVSEFAHKDIRGQLNLIIQLQLVIGMLLAYSLGQFDSLWALNVPFAIVPIVMDVLVLFLPESPVYLYTNGKQEAAKKSLQFFRGESYPLEEELADITEYTKKPDTSLWQVAKQKSTIRGFSMLLILHMIQQFSGINPINFYLQPLFESVTSDIPGGLTSIAMGIARVLATAISTYLVDKNGRRILWLVSLAIMAVMLFIVGFHYQMVASNISIQKHTGYIAIACIFIYLIGFSFGVAPLPWVAAGELLPNRLKILVTIVATISFLLSFVATCTFPLLVDLIGSALVFWIYCGICGFSFMYIFFFFLETKGKSLEEIQKQLGKKDEA